MTGSERRLVASARDLAENLPDSIPIIHTAADAITFQAAIIEHLHVLNKELTAYLEADD